MSSPVLPWQLKNWRQIRETARQGRMPHALLLAGSAGLGIEQFATALAGVLLCDEAAGEGACGRCRSCQLLQSANHPDLFRAEPEEPGKQIKIDSIRELISFVQLSSQYRGYKIAIITPAEAMNRHSANALLKTLEEPPAQALIILVAFQPSTIPVTLRSRCQTLNFAPVWGDDTVAWLAQHAACGVEQSRDALALSGGRPLHAAELVSGDLLARRQQIQADLVLAVRRPDELLKIAVRWNEYGAVDVFAWLAATYAALARARISPASAVMNFPRDLQGMANRLNLPQLLGCYDRAMAQHRAATGAWNLNRSGLLEEFILYWQSLYHNVEETA